MSNGAYSIVRSVAALVLCWHLLGGCGVVGILGASAGGGGGGGGSSRPAAPSVTVVPPSDEVTGYVEIHYDLRDPQVSGDAADPRVRIDPQYRFEPSEFDPNPAWRIMTEAPSDASDGTRPLSLGSHVFAWNSLVDVGYHSGRVQFRILAQYEESEGIARSFRSRQLLEFHVENKFAMTLVGAGAEPPSDVETTPIDVRPDGATFVVADLGANVVERVDATGRVSRLAGYGIAGDTVGTGRDPGVARLRSLGSVEVDAAGTLYSLHDTSLLVTNEGVSDVVFGQVDGPDPDSADDSVVVPRQTILAARVAGLSGARGLRLHPSGVLLVANSIAPAGYEILAINPGDPAEPGAASVVLAGVTVGPGVTVRIAGGGGSTGDGAAGFDAQIAEIASLAIGPDGEIYFAEKRAGRIRVLNASAGPLTIGGRVVEPAAVDTVAGSGVLGSSGDRGPARTAQLNVVGGIAVSPARALFIADTVNREIRVANLGSSPFTFAERTIDPARIDTVVGPGFEGGTKARDLKLTAPVAVALDAAGNLLLCDGPSVILVNGGTVAIGAYGRNAGPARTAVVYDASRRGGLPLDRPRAAHMLSQPGTALFFTDRTTVRVLNFAPDLPSSSGRRPPSVFGGASADPGLVGIVAGGSLPGFSGDGGPARSAAFNEPSALANEGDQKLFVADTGNDRVQFLNIADPRLAEILAVSGVPPDLTAFGRTLAAGDVDTIVGGAPGPLPADGDGLAPRDASLSRPEGLAFRAPGLLFVADTGHHRIRVVNGGSSDVTLAGKLVVAGTIESLVGNGTPGFTSDGPGPWLVDTPTALEADARLLYFADSGNARIRVLNLTQAVVRIAGVNVPAGAVGTIVGTGVRGNFGDLGRGIDARIDTPRSFFIQTKTGTPLDMYFTDGPQQVVRIVNLGDADLLTGTAGGSVDTIAGGPNLPGQPNPPDFDGDGEGAAQMRFRGPWGVAVVQNGNALAHLFICDEGNDRLRRVAPPVTRTPFQNP